MSLLDLILRRQPKTASRAKERLQVIIAREGSRGGNPELIQQIKQAVIEAVGRYVQISPEDINIELDSNNEMEVLSVSVALQDRPVKR